jgi:1-acyl-sn-glycerol-3-phosphate acyltransferase
MFRTIFVVVVTFGYLFLVGPYCIVHALLQRSSDILYSAGRLGCRIGLKLGGIRVTTRGLKHVQNGKPYLFLANHQSYCDPPVLVATIPRNARLILKQELRKIPLLGLIMEMGGFVFINRQDRAQAIEGTKQAVRQLQQGESFLIYPEGTRTRTGRLGPFKKGPFIMAIESGVPIIPITVSGGYEIMPPDRFRIQPGPIEVTFHPAIETRNLALGDRDELMQRVRRTIAAELGEPDSDSAEPVPAERKS